MDKNAAESDRAMSELRDWLSEGGAGFLVLDGLEAAGCPSDGANVRPWFEKHVVSFTDAGVCVLTIDHVPKRREDRPKGAIGSQHKLAAVTDAAFHVEARQPWTKAKGGKLRLRLDKDRPGDVPGGVNSFVAEVVGEYDDGGRFTYRIQDTSRHADVDEMALLAAIGDAGEVHTSRGVRQLMKGTAGTAVDEAVKYLIDEGLLERHRNGRQGYVYSVTEAGAETLAERR